MRGRKIMHLKNMTLNGGVRVFFMSNRGESVKEEIIVCSIGGVSERQGPTNTLKEGNCAI